MSSWVSGDVLAEVWKLVACILLVRALEVAAADEAQALKEGVQACIRAPTAELFDELPVWLWQLVRSDGTVSTQVSGGWEILQAALLPDHMTFGISNPILEILLVHMILSLCVCRMWGSEISLA